MSGTNTVDMMLVRVAKIQTFAGVQSLTTLSTLEDLLAADQFNDAEYFAMSGHLGHVSEAVAIQRALREL